MYVAGRPVKIIHTDNEHENTVNLQARNVSNLLLIMWKNFFKAFETHNDTHLRWVSCSYHYFWSFWPSTIDIKIKGKYSRLKWLWGDERESLRWLRSVLSFQNKSHSDNLPKASHTWIFCKLRMPSSAPSSAHLWWAAGSRNSGNFLPRP